MNHRPRAIHIAPVALLALLALAGCQQNRIEGVVENIGGETLPGVAVSIDGENHFATTDALGQYSIGYVPGDLTLRFIKSGYTPGVLKIDVQEYRPVQAETVRLWMLPPNHGVFLFENNRYQAASPIIPDRFPTAQGKLYGTKKKRIESRTTDTNPTLILYTPPRSGLAMERMERRKLTIKEEGALDTDIMAWVPAASVPVDSVPIDKPEELLRKVRLPGPLAFGVYAVHWGALKGQGKSDEPRMFVFEVYDAAAPQPPAEDEDEDQTPPSNIEPPADMPEEAPATDTDT